MKHRLALGAAAVALLAGTAASQAADVAPVPAPAEVLSALDVADANLQELELPREPGAPFSFRVVLGDELAEIALQPHSLRAEGYRLMVQGRDGSYVEHPPTVETSYRGVVAGRPGSLVAANLFEGRLSAIVRLGEDEPFYGIQALSEVLGGSARTTHVVYSSLDNVPLPVTCGTKDYVLAPPASTGGGGTAEAGSGTKVCEIACDADFEFYQKNGSSVTATENDITTIVNGMDAIYDSEVDIQYDLTVIYVETSAADPYSTTSPSGLLSQFQSHWNSQHGGDQRDVAHLFTGKNMSGSTIGIAYLNVICNLGSAYGVSESKYTGNLTNRIGLTAHEVGHNWSAGHCDGGSDCRIMCSCLGCCGPVTTFGTASEAAINGKKASVGCLDTPPPPSAPILVNLAPSSVTAFQPGTVTLTGAFFEDVTAVNVGSSQVLPPFGVTIVDDSTITLTPPKATSLGAVTVTVENAAGASNPLSLSYVETSPPKASATAFGFTGGSFLWDFGSEADDLWFLYVSVDDGSTVPLDGWSVLANAFFLSSGTLTSAGLGDHSVVVPGGLTGAQIYSQVLVLDGTTFAFEGATNIPVSTILF